MRKSARELTCRCSDGAGDGCVAPAGNLAAPSGGNLRAEALLTAFQLVIQEMTKVNEGIQTMQKKVERTEQLVQTVNADLKTHKEKVRRILKRFLTVERVMHCPKGRTANGRRRLEIDDAVHSSDKKRARASDCACAGQNCAERHSTEVADCDLDEDDAHRSKRWQQVRPGRRSSSCRQREARIRREVTVAGHKRVHKLQKGMRNLEHRLNKCEAKRSSNSDSFPDQEIEEQRTQMSVMNDSERMTQEQYYKEEQKMQSSILKNCLQPSDQNGNQEQGPFLNSYVRSPDLHKAQNAQSILKNCLQKPEKYGTEERKLHSSQLTINLRVLERCDGKEQKSHSSGMKRYLPTADHCDRKEQKTQSSVLTSCRETSEFHDIEKSYTQSSILKDYLGPAEQYSREQNTSSILRNYFQMPKQQEKEQQRATESSPLQNYLRPPEQFEREGQMPTSKSNCLQSLEQHQRGKEKLLKSAPRNSCSSLMSPETMVEKRHTHKLRLRKGHALLPRRASPPAVPRPGASSASSVSSVAPNFTVIRISPSSHSPTLAARRSHSLVSRYRPSHTAPETLVALPGRGPPPETQPAEKKNQKRHWGSGAASTVSVALDSAMRGAEAGRAASACRSACAVADACAVASCVDAACETDGDALGARLVKAAQCGRAGEVRALLAAGAAVDHRAHWRWTPLHWAALRGHARVATLLAKRGADPSARTAMGNTPLHLSAGNGDARCCAALVAAGSNVDAWNEFRRTPLHLGAENGNEAVVRVLLASGASKTIKDYKGRTPFHVAKTENIRNMLFF